jgi:hypothetical protein
MERAVKFTGIMLMLLLANVTISAQHAMRGTMDSTRMNKLHRDMMQKNHMAWNRDSLRTGGMRHNMSPDFRHMYGMRRGMGPGMEYGMRGYMFHGRDFDMRMRMHHGDQMWRRDIGTERLIMESIPNVTDKQKKAIADLREKQQAEMKKFREDMSARIKEMRDSHRKEILNILTDEQKKFLNSQSENTEKAPEKSK